MDMKEGGSKVGKGKRNKKRMDIKRSKRSRRRKKSAGKNGQEKRQ